MQFRRDLKHAIIGALYFFLVLCSFYILKPLRDSSFLTEFHPHSKPFFHLATLGVLFLLASFYSEVIKKFRGQQFIHIFYGFLISNLFLFWLGLDIWPQLTGAIFYTWLSLSNVFIVMVFWTQINSCFPNSHSRLFYIIVGLGGGLGAACGGKITEILAPLIGTNALSLVAAFLLFCAYLCAVTLNRRLGKEVFSFDTQLTQDAGFKSLLRERYAVCILALVVIGTFVQSIYDYQLTNLVAETLPKNKEAYSVFYGALYFKVNLFALFAQIIIAPFILYALGPARGLYVYLLLILGTALILTFESGLYTMEWVFIIFAGSGHSYVQTLREQLYRPASKVMRVSYKAYIDTFGIRAGDSLAAIAFVVAVTLFGFDIVRLDYLVFGSGIVALYFLHQAVTIYDQLNKKNLKSSPSALAEMQNPPEI
jgi:AAA family ATP:ADP antiporter